MLCQTSLKHFFRIDWSNPRAMQTMIPIYRSYRFVLAQNLVLFHIHFVLKRN